MTGLAPIAHPTVDTFLLGLIAGMGIAACLFFLRFWKEMRDSLFLAFALFFGLTVVNAAMSLHLPHPNQGNTWLFMVRLGSILVILVAILRKNFGSS